MNAPPLSDDPGGDDARQDTQPSSPPDLPSIVLKALRGRVAGVNAQPGVYQAAILLSRHDALEMIRQEYPEEPHATRFIGGDGD